MSEKSINLSADLTKLKSEIKGLNEELSKFGFKKEQFTELHKGLDDIKKMHQERAKVLAGRVSESIQSSHSPDELESRISEFRSESAKVRQIDKMMDYRPGSGQGGGSGGSGNGMFWTAMKEGSTGRSGPEKFGGFAGSLIGQTVAKDQKMGSDVGGMIGKWTMGLIDAPGRFSQIDRRLETYARSGLGNGDITQRQYQSAKGMGFMPQETLETLSQLTAAGPGAESLLHPIQKMSRATGMSPDMFSSMATVGRGSGYTGDKLNKMVIDGMAEAVATGTNKSDLPKLYEEQLKLMQQFGPGGASAGGMAETMRMLHSNDPSSFWNAPNRVGSMAGGLQSMTETPQNAMAYDVIRRMTGGKLNAVETQQLQQLGPNVTEETIDRLRKAGMGNVADAASDINKRGGSAVWMNAIKQMASETGMDPSMQAHLLQGAFPTMFGMGQQGMQNVTEFMGRGTFENKRMGDEEKKSTLNSYLDKAMGAFKDSPDFRTRAAVAYTTTAEQQAGEGAMMTETGLREAVVKGMDETGMAQNIQNIDDMITMASGVGGKAGGSALGFLIDAANPFNVGMRHATGGAVGGNKWTSGGDGDVYDTTHSDIGGGGFGFGSMVKKWFGGGPSSKMFTNKNAELMNSHESDEVKAQQEWIYKTFGIGVNNTGRDEAETHRLKAAGYNPAMDSAHRWDTKRAGGQAHATDYATTDANILAAVRKQFPNFKSFIHEGHLHSEQRSWDNNKKSDDLLTRIARAVETTAHNMKMGNANALSGASKH